MSARLLLLCVLATGLPAQVTVSVGGELRRWHKVTLTLTGPSSSETATANPFLDWRFEVRFQHRGTGLTYLVPGYFAADGQAAESSATKGDQWRAHLSPDHTGIWDYTISLRGGAGVAIGSVVGAAVTPYDGVKGSFVIAESDKSGRDHRGKGRLRYVGRHHLRFANGEWFLKAGADSPENLLAYDDFDNTPDTGGWRKAFKPHAKDWRVGDPTFRGTKGKGLIGALNYLAGKGMNAVSFLTYNYNGDDKNVFPYRDPKDRTRMDCSKLDQWEIVFAHADRIGLYLHVKTQETENDQDLDKGGLGAERKLYYRELVARFGHHLALNWNLGEENTNTTAEQQAFAQWFFDHDPYRHLVVLHTYPGQQNTVYTPLLGSKSKLTGVSLQVSPPSLVFQETLTWVQASAKAGAPWVVSNDEQGGANTGILPDASDPSHDAARSLVLWGNLMAGGAGIESYFGYAYPNSDLSCENWRSRDRWWDQCRHALRFFGDNHVPFASMGNRQDLVDAGACLAGAGVFVVYLPSGGTANLDLSGVSGSLEVWWFDPRRGGALQQGSVLTVVGGGRRGLGNPPSDATKDWVVLVRPVGPPASATIYGRGCGAVGTAAPDIAAAGLPVLGDATFGVLVSGARASSTGVVAVGAVPQAIAVGPCTVLVQPLAFLALATDGAGAARLPMSVPFELSLLGGRLCLQAAVADPAGPFAGAALSAGLDLRVGYR